MGKRFDPTDIAELVLDTEEQTGMNRAQALRVLLKGSVNDHRLHDAIIDYSVAAVEEATYDPIMGKAFTRRHYDGLAEKILDRAHSYGGSQAYIIVDMDKFKAINDIYGHPVGDEALKLFGETAAEVLNEQAHTYTLVRYGGDEILLILDGATRHEASEVSERLRNRLRLATAKERFGIQTFSAGVAMYEEDGTDVETLIACADRRLYDAKHAGRNQTHTHDLYSVKPLEAVAVGQR